MFNLIVAHPNIGVMPELSNVYEMKKKGKEKESILYPKLLSSGRLNLQVHTKHGKIGNQSFRHTVNMSLPKIF